MVIAAIMALGALVAVVEAPGINFGTFGILYFLALPTLPLIRSRWAFVVLFTLLTLWVLFIVILVASDVSVDPEKSGQQVWGLFIAELYLCYFWRRRWWYGFPLSVAVPEKSPPGVWRLAVECFVIAFATAVLAVIIDVLLAD